MSAYFQTLNGSLSTNQDTAGHFQPAVIHGPVIHKYTLVMPSPKPSMNDCHAEKNMSDICAAIRHHILDQVTAGTNTGSLVSTKQNAVKGVCSSNGLTSLNSASSYCVRGTK